MKKLLSASIAAATIAGFAAPAAAVEGLSANVGVVSDYYFRGANLGDAGAYAGLDYEVGGFYAGTWVIDDGAGGNDGVEADFYLGYGFDFGAVTMGIGAATYQYSYTGDSETEATLSFGFANFGLNLTYGNDDDVETTELDDDGVEQIVEASDQDYYVIDLSYGGDVFGATIGYVGYEETKSDAEDDYYWVYAEVSAGGEIAGLDMAVVLGQVLDNDDGAAEVDDTNPYIYLDISKSFDI